MDFLSKNQYWQEAPIFFERLKSQSSLHKKKLDIFPFQWSNWLLFVTELQQTSKKKKNQQEIKK